MERNIKLGPRHRKTCVVLSMPHNLAGSSQRGLHSSRCPSRGGLYLLRQRLAVIVFHNKILCACICVCVCACVSFAENRHQRRFTRPSGPFYYFIYYFIFFSFCGQHSLAVDYKQKDLTASVCLCVRLAPCDPSLHVSFSAGISLLVPHGGIAEDTTWEMYMIISQEDSR